MKSRADSPPKTVIRKARVSDGEPLLGLIREYYRYDGIRFEAKSIASALRKLLGDESLGCVWIIEQDAALTGYVILTFNFDLEFGGLQGIVTDLFLREKYRGRGLGKMALEQVADYCRAKGIAAVELQVEHDNKAAQKFYGRLGFRRLPRIVMAKDL